MKEISFMTLKLFVPRIIWTSVGCDGALVDQLMLDEKLLRYLPFKIFARYKFIYQSTIAECEGERGGKQ